MKTKIYFLLFAFLLITITQSSFGLAVTLTTPAIAAANINQGTNNNIVYATQMAVSSAGPISVNNIQFTLGGTQDVDDIVTVLVYFNATAVNISGASFLGSAVGSFAAPHTYSIGIGNNMAASTQGFYIIAVNVSTSATDNHTVLINGTTNPCVFGFTSSVNVTNNQSNKALAQTIQAADITLTTPAIAAANINQGTNNNIIYATQMAVSATEPVTVNNIQFTLSGTQDADDIVTVLVYFNATAVSISGASFLGSAVGSFAAPHTYSIGIGNNMAAGTQGFYIIAVNVSASATDNHTISINGATTPVVFGFTTSPNITNSQTNKAVKQTIQAADITLTTPVIAAANINQGTNNNIIYATQMVVSATEPVTVNNIQFTLSGTQDADDIVTVLVYFNATAVSISGASFLGSAVGSFAAPHTYSIGIGNNMAAGTQGFYIIAVNVSTSATDNHTISINGATTPVVFGFTTSPNITNSQTNKAVKQTIQAADITLTTPAIAAANINQGTNNNIIYATQMAVSATEPVTVNNIQFTLSGTQDADDIVTVLVYFNATAVSISGASFLGSAVGSFAAPHTYSIGIGNNMAAGTQGFYIIAVNVSTSATDNHTISINGATTPVVFGFTTSPNITNSQTNKAVKQTIQAADITLTTPAIAAANINQGTNNNIIYATQMVVATEPVTVNNIQFTLSGTQDADDIVTVLVYFNATAVSISGASFLGSAVGSFAAPHTYSIGIGNNMAAGTQGFYIIAVNVSTSATDNHTVSINGATTPVVFGFTTSPNITNSQTNKAVKQTIQAADITLTTPVIAAGNIKVGSNSNIIYATQMVVATEPVTVNNIQFTLSGTQDADDIVTVLVYFNATAVSISGASFLGSAVGSFAAPHTYSIGIGNNMAAGTQGFYIVAVNVSSTATIGKTVKVNGATDPTVFGFTTSPNITNSQANNAGTQTISATLTMQDMTSIMQNSTAVLNDLFPNPANSSFNYLLNANGALKLMVMMTDASGKIVMSRMLSLEKGNNKFSMDVSSLANGSYRLVASGISGNLLLNKQVIVNH